MKREQESPECKYGILKRMKSLLRAIIHTLAYADVFDYPLTPEELYRLLIPVYGSQPATYSKEDLNKELSYLLKVGNCKLNDGYYFLRGREKIVDLRRKRERWGHQKLRIAEEVAGWLKLIPWIKMVGVTGNLAMKNADLYDDIDILIVSARNRLWLTRLAATILVELTSQRRHPPKARVSFLPKNRNCDILSTRDIRDKICLNMFLDKDHLAVPEKERDLFSCHEVIQMKLLWDKDNTYQKFLAANRWVKRFLPNALNRKNKISRAFLRIENRKKTKKKENIVFDFMENLVKICQLWYMRKRRTTEIISRGIIRFHPHDARQWVLAEYKKRLEKLGA